MYILRMYIYVYKTNITHRQLLERYAPDQLEARLGGTLDAAAARPCPRPYSPRPLDLASLPAAATRPRGADW